MTAIHVLEATRQGTYRAVFHFPVPNVANAVGINYRTALLTSGIGLQPDGRRTVLHASLIESAEETQLDAGEVYEEVFGFDPPDGASPAELLAMVRAKYARVQQRVQDRIADQLRYYGFSATAS